MASTTMMINVSIDLSSVAGAQHFASVIQFLTSSGIAFTLAQAGADAPTPADAPAQKPTASGKAGKGKGKTQTKSETKEQPETATVPTALTVALQQHAGNERRVSFSFAETRFSNPGYQFLRQQALVIDPKALYNRAKDVKAFEFTSKVRAAKFISAFNGHVITAEEQMRAMEKAAK